MPNVAGLRPANDLLNTLPQQRMTAYGPHTTAMLTGHLITLSNLRGVTLASVDFTKGDKPRVKADLRAIDGDTVTAVNALLRPYGKVQSYWRTGEYRWHPVDGKPSAPRGRAQTGTVTPSVPVASPVSPETGTGTGTNPALAPITVVEKRQTAPITFKVAAAGGQGVTVPTERRHTGKVPTVRRLTKTFSQMGEVLLPTTDVGTLDRAWTRRAAGAAHHVLITGPAGTAKTRLAQEFAFSKGVPFLIVEGQGIQTAADWYGGFVPAAGGFEWQWSDFGLALLRGEPMVILVDEINRAENERALNGLMGLLAWTAQTHPVGAPQALTLSPGILICATLNEGVEYVGTVEIDAAVRDRFAAGVRMDYTPLVVETKVLLQQAPGLDKEVAKRLATLANTQRAKRDDDTLFPSHNVISTRVLIDIAQTIEATGCTPTEAIWAACKVRFQREDEDALSVLIEAQFGPNPEASPDLADDDEIEQMLSGSPDGI
jgi:MoxR-like ATPase